MFREESCRRRLSEESGSFTVEAALLMSLVAVILAAVILFAFRLHDRTVLAGFVTRQALSLETQGEAEVLQLTGMLTHFPAAVTVEKSEDRVRVSARARAKHAFTGYPGSAVFSNELSAEYEFTYIASPEALLRQKFRERKTP